MTFSCKNYDFGTDGCNKLHADCIPGRPGCVLEGKVKVSENLAARLRDLAEKTGPRPSGKRREKRVSRTD